MAYATTNFSNYAKETSKPLPAKGAIALGKKIVKVWTMIMRESLLVTLLLLFFPVNLALLALASLAFAPLALIPLALAPLHSPLPRSPL